jgi:hypothetical protein
MTDIWVIRLWRLSGFYGEFPGIPGKNMMAGRRSKFFYYYKVIMQSTKYANYLVSIDGQTVSTYNINPSKPSEPVTLYFLLDDSNVSLLTNENTHIPKKSGIKCNDVIIIDSKNYIKLTWENLNGLGTNEQKIAINAFRLKYVTNLKAHIEGSNSTNNATKITCCINSESCKIDQSCRLEGVGTTENISAASDIDMNFYFKFTPTNATEIIENIRLLYEKINKFHYSKFITPFEDLFDMNIYATNLYSKECNTLKCTIKNCSKDMCKINKYDTNTQRKWAFYRAAEVIQNNQLNISSIDNIQFQNLYTNTLAFINDIKNSHKTTYNTSNIYINSVIKSYNSLKNNNTIIDINSFSKAKVYERETYRSAGAFLHIVAKRKDLDHNLYIDSILDNYGFLLENLYHKPSCFKLDIQIKLLRVAKYLERMCDAIILYFTDIYNLNSSTQSNSFQLMKHLYNEVNILKEVSMTINLNRKTNKDSINELNTLSVLLKNFNKTYTNTDKDNTPLKDLDENKWFERLTSIFDSIYLAYNPNNHTSKLNGGSLNKIRILGRLRNITVINNKKYITYKKENILLSDALKLDKKSIGY